MSPYLPNKFTENNNKKRANKWEKKKAKELGYDLTRASGATLFDKGDIKSDGFMGELKKTEQESISLRRDWLIKVAKEAEDDNKDWFLHIGFTDIADNPLFNCVVISEKLFKILDDIIKENVDGQDL